MLSVVIPARELGNLVEKAETAYPFADEVIIQLDPPGRRTGIASARNAGARKARGDIFLFTDDDTDLELLARWDPDPSESFWVAKEILPCCDDPHTTTSCHALTALVNLKRMRWLASIGPFMACRRQVFAQLGGFRRAPQEDTDFGNRAKALGVSIGVAPFRVRVNRPFSLQNVGMAIDQFQRDAFLPWEDGPAVVVRTARLPAPF